MWDFPRFSCGKLKAKVGHQASLAFKFDKKFLLVEGVWVRLLQFGGVVVLGLVL